MNDAINTAASKLATLTDGTLSIPSVVEIAGKRPVSLHVYSTEITMWVGPVFETFPKGLTYRQIADHALAVSAGGTVAPLSRVYGPWDAQSAA